MHIVGCDLHTRYPQIAMLDRDTGVFTERRVAQAIFHIPCLALGNTVN